MRRAIITGANGFIGKALTETLLSKGVSVCAIVTDAKKMDEFRSHPSFSIIQATFQDYGSLEVPFDADVCFHLAWSGVSTQSYHDPHAQLRNCDAACTVAEIAAKFRCRKMVFVGSTHQCQNIVQCDKTRKRKLTAYGSAKSCAIELCTMIAQDHNVCFSAAAFPNVFGIGDFSRRSTNLILLQFLRRSCPQLIPGDILYDCIYIEDAVRGLIAIAERGRNGAQYYLGHQEIGTFQQVVEIMRDAVAPNVPLTFGTIETAIETDYTQFDLELAHTELGYAPICDLKESMQKTAAWLQNNDASFEEAH